MSDRYFNWGTKSRALGAQGLKRRNARVLNTTRALLLCASLLLGLALPPAAAAQGLEVLPDSKGGSSDAESGHEDSFTPEPESDETDLESESPATTPSKMPAELAGISAQVLELIQGSSELPDTFVEAIRDAVSNPLQSDIRYNDDVTLPVLGDGSIGVLLNESSTIGIQLEGATGRPEILGDWGIHYGGEVSSIVTFPRDAILETFTIVESEQSPQYYNMVLNLPDGFRLVLADGSGAAIVDSEGIPAIFVDAPLAVDANGDAVELALHVNNNQLVLDVDHRHGEYTYPIVADPVWYYFGKGYRINHAEFEYCKWPSRYRICYMAFSESRSALSLAQRYFAGRNLHNGVGDAFRHCYWSAAMTIRISHSKAREFGDMHETTPGQPAIEKKMDQRNNGIGRSVGTRVRNLHGGVLYRAEVDCLDKADDGGLWIIDSSDRLRRGR